MATVDFDAFDADNHYYEATDAFTRHLPANRSRLVTWATINGKPRMVVDNKVFRFIPNPTFDPVAKPGVLDEYFRGKRAGDSIRDAFGDLEPINPAYREPEARLKLMDAQRLQGCFMFPTLGVGVEEALLHDPAALHDVFHAFNEWMHDDWTFNYEDRIYAAPYICLQDPERAVQEVDWALEHGAHVVVMRSGPVRGPGFGRSPGDAVYDPMWARLAEAGILTAYHSGDAGYGRYADEWGSGGDFQAFRNDPFRTVTGGHRPIYDTIAALVCHGVFTPPPERASRDDRERLGLGAAPAARAEEVVRPGADGVRRGRSGAAAARPRVGVAVLRGQPPAAPRRARREPHDLRLRLPARRRVSPTRSRSSTTSPASRDDEIRLVMRENALELSVPRT